MRDDKPLYGIRAVLVVVIVSLLLLRVVYGEDFMNDIALMVQFYRPW